MLAYTTKSFKKHTSSRMMGLFPFIKLYIIIAVTQVSSSSKYKNTPLTRKFSVTSIKGQHLKTLIWDLNNVHISWLSKARAIIFLSLKTKLVSKTITRLMFNSNLCQHLNNCAPNPPLTQQQSNDKTFWGKILHIFRSKIKTSVCNELTQHHARSNKLLLTSSQYFIRKLYPHAIKNLCIY